MDNLKIANILLKFAKSLEAEYEYRSDPDHKHKPKGGGWKQTKQGWSKSDNSNQTTDSNTSNADSTSTQPVKPEDYGNVNAPIRKAIKAFRESNTILSKDIRTLFKNMDKLGQSKEKSRQELERYRQSKEWSAFGEAQLEKQYSRTNYQNLHASNLIALGVSEERRGKLPIRFIKAKTQDAKTCIEKIVSAMECLVDKNMISNREFSIRTDNRFNRSHYSVYDREIVLVKEEQYDIATIAHEIGHYIEFSVPGTWTACSDFLDARTEGENAQSLQDLTGYAYDITETAKPDHFFIPIVAISHGMERKFYQWG